MVRWASTRTVLDQAGCEPGADEPTVSSGNRVGDGLIGGESGGWVLNHSLRIANDHVDDEVGVPDGRDVVGERQRARAAHDMKLGQDARNVA